MESGRQSTSTANTSTETACALDWLNDQRAPRHASGRASVTLSPTSTPKLRPSGESARGSRRPLLAYVTFRQRLSLKLGSGAGVSASTRIRALHEHSAGGLSTSLTRIVLERQQNLNRRNNHPIRLAQQPSSRSLVDYGHAYVGSKRRRFSLSSDPPHLPDASVPFPNGVWSYRPGTAPASFVAALASRLRAGTSSASSAADWTAASAAPNSPRAFSTLGPIIAALSATTRRGRTCNRTRRGPTRTAAGACRSRRPVLQPRYNIPSCDSALRRINEGSRNSPVRCSPRLRPEGHGRLAR